VGLALDLIWQALFGLIVPSKAFDEAQVLAQIARDNGEELEAAHCLLGFIQLFDRNFPGAEDSFNESRNYDPNYSYAYEGYAILRTAQERFEEALDWIEKAIEINPGRFFCYVIRGLLYYEWGDDKKAVQSLEECKELEPYFDAVYFPALTALRCSEFFQAWAKGLQERGKSKMSVICAVMRKLIHVAYGVLKSGKPFDPQWVKTA
jgi:tetratricopeptide (TPR) repeat protein